MNTNFVILEDPLTETLQLTVNNSVMSYWSGATTYQITELTDDKLVIRGIQETFDPPGTTLAWYHTFVPADATPPPPGCGGSTGDTGSGNNDVLVWADEFNTDGAPCDENWSYNIGTGEGGWGNWIVTGPFRSACFMDRAAAESHRLSRRAFFLAFP